MEMSMEHLWNVTEGDKPKYWETTLAQWRFVQHEYHVHWPGIVGRGIVWAMAQPTEAWIMYIQIYRAVNTLPFGYKNQLVNAVYGNNRSLFSDPQTTHKHPLWAERANAEC